MTKTILVTGATSGFGKATAELFAKNGFNVIATGRRLERLQALQEEYSNIYPLQLDVTDKEDVYNKLSNLPQHVQNIDILVNNAGLALGLEKVQDAKLDDWEQMIDTNIKGLLYVTKAVINGMIERNSGYIFNIGSIAGNWPYYGANVYGSTKSFVQQFSLNLRNDLVGTKVRVSNIEPGFAQTEFSQVRFKGDKKRADDLYASMVPLVGDDIANLIFTLSALPEHVNVNTLEVMPTCQTWAGFHFESE